MTKIILKHLQKPDALIEYVKDRPGHDKRYAINNTKIQNELGWKPERTFDEGIKDTINWYVENIDWLKEK